jgi:hypothetical protein
MSKKLLLFAIIINCFAFTTKAYDFSAVYDGQTIYYNITSSTAPQTVEVTHGDVNVYSGVVITIPGNVSYGGNAYSVTKIGEWAFFGCSNLTSITLPNTLTSIGEWAFVTCKNLTSITLSNTLTSIGEAAFSACYSLTFIALPNTLTSIGDGAFYNCYNIRDIYVYSATPPTAYSEIAFHVNSSCTLHVPTGSKAAYEVVNGWSGFTTRILDNLTGLSLPDSNPISIYPNPTSGEIYIGETGRINTVRIFDVSGKQILETSETTFNIAYLPAGLYYVSIRTDKGTTTHKVIKK